MSGFLRSIADQRKAAKLRAKSAVTSGNFATNYCDQFCDTQAARRRAEAEERRKAADYEDLAGAPAPRLSPVREKAFDAVARSLFFKPLLKPSPQPSLASSPKPFPQAFAQAFPQVFPQILPQALLQAFAFALFFSGLQQEVKCKMKKFRSK